MTLIRFSEERGCSELHAHLTECVKKTPTQAVFVHKDCRRDLTNQRRSVCCNVSENDQLHASSKKVKIQCVNCLLIGKRIACFVEILIAQFNAHHPERDRVNVTTLPIRDILECGDR